MDQAEEVTDVLQQMVLFTKPEVMDWIELKEESQLDDIKNQSKETPQVIFKHSTRCSISSMAKSRLERASSSPAVNYYILDLIQHRNISQKIAEDFKVHHESPQVLLIKDGHCIYDESHSGINMDEIAELIPAI
ncbi:MAG TPA: bacillithiol system redox-active protein YtxJ [Ferruginibacter sp.]|nr:bacillithiol system redox-active protein YtxJ [Ferruginibacter sp.]